MKACIVYISSRNECIKLSIKSLWDNYNHKYDYPVYVHYFDDIYDSEEFREEVRKVTSPNVHFISVPYNTPGFLKEQDLFYNRHELWYVRNSFPKSRKGFLHMCHFTSNMYGYENTELEKYDYIMTHDDESGYTKEMPYDPFEVMANRPEDMAAFKKENREEKQPHQGNFDTRVNLWEFIKSYIKHYEIKPKSEFMKKLIEDSDSDRNFHFYPVVDTYVLKTEMFKTKEWKQWIKAINRYGGIYKYRWGDNDVYSLFYLIHYEHPIYDLKTVNEGYHDQGMFRHLQDYAPGVKDLEK